MANPAVTFKNPKGVTTGEYGDSFCSDELLWASAELWRTTGGARYERAFFDAAAALAPTSLSWVPEWNNVASLGYWTWLMAGRKTTGAMVLLP